MFHVCLDCWLFCRSLRRLASRSTSSCTIYENLEMSSLFHRSLPREQSDVSARSWQAGEILREVRTPISSCSRGPNDENPSQCAVEAAMSVATHFLAQSWREMFNLLLQMMLQKFQVIKAPHFRTPSSVNVTFLQIHDSRVEWVPAS